MTLKVKECLVSVRGSLPLMKRASLFVIALCSVLSVRAEIQFKGLLVADGAAKFSLYESEEQTSKWVSIGENFAGYAVTEFRPGGDVLVLRKGNEVLELKMTVPHIASSRPAGLSAAAAEELAKSKDKLYSAQERLRALTEQRDKAKERLKSPRAQ